MPNRSNKPESQKAKFERAARELETDDSEEAFDAKLRRIVKSPPQKDKAETGEKSKD